ncbi:MAG: hypothetical protein HY332_20770 [Chloroflexi bacterium]|nr:hypothetical protein [Chloroflexota bacterium]
MGFLNLSAWRSVGGRSVAERRATAVQAPPPKYYYEHIHEIQGMIDRYFETHGHRPPDLTALYLWQLEQEGALGDDVRAADLADLLSYYDIEPNSLLAMVSIDPNKPARARKLLEARRLHLAKRQAVQRRPSKAPAAAVRAAATPSMSGSAEVAAV